MIPAGEWLPDIADLQNPGTTKAENVSPLVDGFGQLKALAETSTALTAYCRGAMAAKDKTDVTYNYSGDGTSLYENVSGIWIDRSGGCPGACGTYAVGARDAWEFAKWGEKIIAVGGVGVSPQIMTMGGTAFAALGGTPPKARHIAVVRNFVVLANYEEGGVVYPNYLRWSGHNDETQWTTDRAKQSDYHPLEGRGGWIQAVRGGEYGVILQEHSIRRMEYVGPKPIFRIDETMPGVGTPAPNSVVQKGDMIFALLQNGFEVIVQGEQGPEIGKNKINKWFFDRVDANNMHRVVGAYDRENRRVVWIFPSTSASNGLPDSAIIFDTQSGRWSYFETELEWIYDSFGEGTTMEQLDAVSASLDALSGSLDSREWIGGAILLTGFSSAHKAGTFSGSAMDAVIETSEQKINGDVTFLRRVRPEVDSAGTVTVAIGSRNDLSDMVSWSSTISKARDGAFPCRSRARYHRIRTNISGGFKRMQGVSVLEAQADGAF